MLYLGLADRQHLLLQLPAHLLDRALVQCSQPAAQGGLCLQRLRSRLGPLQVVQGGRVRAALGQESILLLIFIHNCSNYRNGRMGHSNIWI